MTTAAVHEFFHRCEEVSAWDVQRVSQEIL
jgi:hypothetical protein